MSTNDGERTSVTGTLYVSEDDDAPVVTLFTKEGCTLCDKVKDVSEIFSNPLALYDL